MKKLVDDAGLIYRCCKMYYEDRLSQHQIADRLAVSRVTVSRMLSAGRDMGIVRIEVVEPEPVGRDEGRAVSRTGPA